MLVVLRRGGVESDFDLTWPRRGSATVADLLDAMSVAPAGEVWIDGVPVAPRVPLSDVDLRHGSLLTTDDPTRPPAQLRLDVVGGPSAGRSIPIGRAWLTAGQSAACDLQIEDPALGGRHFTIRRVGADGIEVIDLDSGSGTWVSHGAATGTHRPGVALSAGTSRMVAQRLAEEPPPAPNGASVLKAPEKPVEPGEAQPLPWLSIAAPIVLGVGLAWLFHPMMILVGVMSPVMLLAGWMERRRQLARKNRQREAEWRGQLEQFSVEVAAAHAFDELRARAAHRGPSDLLGGGLPIAEEIRPVTEVSTGVCDRRWLPTLADPGTDLAEVSAVLTDTGPLRDVPAVLRIQQGDRISVTGPRHPAAALTRWITIQLAMWNRPEDLHIGVLADPVDPAWSWVSRLPHAAGAAPAGVEIGCPHPEPTVTVRAGGRSTADGLPVDVAGELARRIALRETPAEGGSMQPGMTIADALGVGEPSADWCLDNWTGNRTDRLPTVLGFGPNGIEQVDLASVGPHALVGGTTGAGKSEMLRAMVATTAALLPPDQVNFILIDYKGGSAFDACADLPHVVGVVTDLDQTLAERALRCLHAELRFREAELRRAGVSDISALESAALPRLCIVIDELATLVADLPRFTENLVGVAQRGRSLGVHLILATQRPSGSLSPAIRTNTSLRICLRVPDPLDSDDVVGDAVASRIPRDLPGRAWVRCGPAELRPVQGVDTSAPLVAAEVQVAGEPTLPRGPSGLEVVAGATQEAWTRLGGGVQRRPWPEPLPSIIHRSQLPAAARGVGIGLADDPDNQRIECLTWDPDAGHLVVVGGPRTGRTTALRTAAEALAEHGGSDFAVIDAAGGGLRPLTVLPPCTERLDLSDLAAVRDLLGALGLRTRGARSDQDPQRLVIVDNLGGVIGALEDAGDFAQVSALGRLFSDGPALGLAFAVSVDRPASIPRGLAAATSTQIVLSLNDPLDYLSVGLPGQHEALIPGRGHEIRTGRAVQLATPTWV